MNFTSKLILSLVVSLFCIASTHAQSELPKDTAEYFTYYTKLFDEKGTIEVRDGMHKVIVTVRYKEDSMVTKICYEGMIRVENNRLVPPLLLKDDKTNKYVKNTKKVDPDSYKKYKIPVDTKIINGRSQTYILETGELGDIFFIDCLKK